MEILVVIVARSDKIDDIQAGEVLTVQPDGHQWSLELSNPNWRIISAPILPTHANMLQILHTPSNLRVSGKKYPRKGYLLNLSTLEISEPNGAVISMTNEQIVNATTKVN